LPDLKKVMGILEKLGTDADLELFVLKCHLVVERKLYWLLAKRLDIEEKQLPALQFYPLCKLALGGERYKILLAAVLALNDVRNEIGHELDDGELNKKWEVLAKHTDVFWPPDDFPEKEELALLRDACARVAALTACVITGAAVIDVSLEKKLYASKKKERSARETLFKTRVRFARKIQEQRPVSMRRLRLLKTPSAPSEGT
jgi:hypothetical protein